MLGTAGPLLLSRFGIQPIEPGLVVFHEVALAELRRHAAAHPPQVDEALACGGNLATNVGRFLRELQQSKVLFTAEGTLFKASSKRIATLLLPVPVGPSFLMGLPKMELPTETVEKDGEATYTVRLHFAEPDNVREGERVFDVSIQGRNVLQGFDIVKEAGGANRSLVKEFKGVRVGKEITLSFTARQGMPLLCGIDLQAE